MNRPWRTAVTAVTVSNADYTELETRLLVYLRGGGRGSEATATPRGLELVETMQAADRLVGGGSARLRDELAAACRARSIAHEHCERVNHRECDYCLYLVARTAAAAAQDKRRRTP